MLGLLLNLIPNRIPINKPHYNISFTTMKSDISGEYTLCLNDAH
jgi:hypothetical protein